MNLRKAIKLLLIAGMFGAAQADPAADAGVAAQAKAEAKNACTADTPEAALDAFEKLGNTVPDIRLAFRSRYMAMGRPADLLLYRPPAQAAAAGQPELPKLAYRIVIVDWPLAGTKRADNLLGKDDVSAAEATQGDKGTDFKKTETKSVKTLLSFTPTLLQDNGYEGPPWSRTKLLVIGCAGPDASLPAAKAELAVSRSSTGWSRFIAVVFCALCYIFATIGTYFVHQRQRIDKVGRKPGTNYATLFQHLDPVILTAGSNGLGSATKLQVLFFSLLVFGVVTYIWLLTGHLTEMSQTVLLLMGISGIGATASAGTELTKNRLDFENWSWLVNSEWLPKGGVAEENIAQWKDIVTTGGEFDATRFQMITFSLLVGGALLTAGADLMDLSSFEIPTTLLGILGLSQVVYVAGKLTAPPAISDLNTQLQKLRKAESDLRDALSKVNSGSLVHTTIPMVDDQNVQVASIAFSHYYSEWETSKTMFEATLGRLVPRSAEALRPPFDVSDIVKPTPNALPDAIRGTAYSQDLVAFGGVADYKWAVVKGSLSGLTLGTVAGQTEVGHIGGTPASPGQIRFTVKVADANGLSNSREFVLNVL